jgi:inositol phosphorylceramide mannosyltransferase catalytic subunit
VLLSIIALTTFITLYASRTLLHQTWNLLTLPITWPSTSAGRFLIDEHLDDFDLTFANYSISQTTAGPGHADLVPPILHHIVLGPQAGRRRHDSHPRDVDAARSHDTEWHAARQACLDLHPDWEAMMWTDANARDFVSEHYPAFLDEWDNYRYPIQRIDALRYLVLYHYGGVILDMDLQCKRALGPLRRFEFVAPAAYPTGFSIGFMMASKENSFVGEVVKSLSAYNRRWFGFPYPTVMFSTGCHFAS